MEVVPLLVSLISGAVGGNLAGSIFKDISLGTVGNSVAGILGGGIGGQILAALLGISAGGGMDLAGILGNVASSGAGGAVLLAVVGIIKKMMS